MRFRSIAVILVSLAMASSASAQGVDPACSSAGQAQDVCQKTVDLFRYMVPQLGISLVGGNTTMGQGGALGGLPHFTLGLRANIVKGGVPNIPTPAAGAAQSTNMTIKDTPLGLPAVDAAIGLFKGVPLPLTNVGGVDLLLSASYVPDVNQGQVSVKPETPVQIGYGARIGILQESLLLPGVGVSFIKRDLPTTTITGTVQATGVNDTLKLSNMKLKTTAWRVTASKSLILFTIAAGVGGDKYDVATDIRAALNHTIPPVTASATPSVKTTMSRTNYFADLSMNILLLKIIGEVGMVQGGDMPTFNTFTTSAAASRMYGSVGLRLGF